MKKSIFALAVLGWICAADGHPGRTDASGGHNDRKNGGYHYHGGSTSRSTPAVTSEPSNSRSTAVSERPQVTQQVIVARPAVRPPVEKAEIDAKILAWQVKQAAAGSASAQFDLGVRHLTGNGVEKDLETAISLLELAATAGHPQAQKRLDEALQEKDRLASASVIEQTSGDGVEQLKKENDLLRKENQELRRLLANGGTTAQAASTTAQSSVAPSIGSAVASGEAPQTGKWTISSTGKRHNSSCRYYGTGKPCGLNDGVACKICGG